jgi:ABC-type lipoprotein release transport system permease subunit
MRSVISRDAMGEFSLRPSQGEVRAVFLPLDRVQRDMEVDGMVNTLLLTAQADVRSRYTLEDIGLRLRAGQIEHRSLILDDYLVSAIREADPQAQPVFTYLANTIRANGREVPYSLVAAIDRPDIADENSIVLNSWTARELNARPGDAVELEYYLWDPSGRLTTEEAPFRLTSVEPVQPSDRDLAPEYPGISGAESVADWDPPFPIELKRIRTQDEDYWNRYRATPKAYIRLAAGQKLWRSKYGAVTSVRISPAFNAEKLRRSINPERAGLTVVNARQEALQASRGSTNFGEYFMYFSFFLVISGLLLTGLFFRLGLEQRARETETLRAMGYPHRMLRRLFLTEGALLGLAGGLLGALGALAWGSLILLGLRTWWVEAVGTRELALHFSLTGVLIAMAAALAIGPAVILLSLRERRRTAPALRTRSWFSIAALVCGIAALIAGGPGGFFAGGALLMIAALGFLLGWLRGTPGKVENVRSLGFRYTAHRPGRSILCIALIAAASFLIVAVDSFRRDTTSDGPWRYFAESAIPLFYDPNTAEGRDALNLSGAPQAQWLKFRLRPGDDASCLNLYAPRNPRVAGVPKAFLVLPPQTDGTIPAAVDANTLQYVLHRKAGDVIEVGGARLKIVQALPDSVFQSELLIPEEDFQRAWPEEGGYRVFLLNAPEGSEAAFETALADYGFDIITSADRRAAYHRVENTYLSTFQSLGALGLVLGTVGLAAVLLRNLLERRRELALLRAVGYRPAQLAKMTLAENVFLLAAGLGIGTVCALVAVVPTVVERGGSLPVTSIVLLLAAVTGAGLAASLVALRFVGRSPLLEALRSE